MKLLVESYDQTNLLCESKEDQSGKKHYYIEGIFLQGDIKNRNGRVYPTAVLEKAINEYQKVIDEHKSYGEIEHPKNPEDAASIKFENITHLIEKVWKDPNSGNWYGRARILDTPKGKIIQSLLEAGGTVSTSSRGMGNVIKENDAMKVSDLKFITVSDLCWQPSGPDCTIPRSGVIYEDVDYEFNETTGEYYIVSEQKQGDCKDCKDCKDCTKDKVCEKCADEQKKQDESQQLKDQKQVEESVEQQTTKLEEQCVSFEIGTEQDKGQITFCRKDDQHAWTVDPNSKCSDQVKALFKKPLSPANTEDLLKAHLSRYKLNPVVIKQDKQKPVKVAESADTEQQYMGTIDQVTEAQIAQFKALLNL